MTLFFLVFILLIMALAEYASRRDDLRHIHISFDIDSKLIEPDELVTLRYTVTNTSPLPILYAGLTLQFAPELVIHTDDERLRTQITRDFTGTRIDQHFYLMPYQRFRGKLQLSVQRRGVYELCSYYLETGDLLGLKPVIRSGSTDFHIVCTARNTAIPALQPRGGFLGDISVRRFIIDDPCMLRGYREYSGREPMKQISWLQSARTGTLTVRQNDFTVDRNVTVLVNMDAEAPRLMEHCMELLRQVSEALEAERIPYSLYSNGDLSSLSEGVGRGHMHFVQRKIGLSRLTAYYSFSTLVDRCLRRRTNNNSYIVITASQTAETRAGLAKLQRYSDHELCVLYGGESYEQ